MPKARRGRVFVVQFPFFFFKIFYFFIFYILYFFKEEEEGIQPKCFYSSLAHHGPTNRRMQRNKNGMESTVIGPVYYTAGNFSLKPPSLRNDGTERSGDRARAGAGACGSARGSASAGACGSTSTGACGGGGPIASSSANASGARTEARPRASANGRAGARARARAGPPARGVIARSACGARVLARARAYRSACATTHSRTRSSAGVRRAGVRSLRTVENGPGGGAAPLRARVRACEHERERETHR